MLQIYTMNIESELLTRFEQFRAPERYFLSFEGIEGAGKTTQITRFKQYLEDQGYNVLLVREPGGTLFGEQLRKAILESKTKLDPIAEAHLFASSRAQLLFEKSLPHLEQAKSVVIYDRYIDSSFAYQGMARGLGIDTVLELHAHRPLNILPTKTFYIKISLDCSMHRQEVRAQEKDYFESEKRPFYQKLINGYEQAMQLFPNRIESINGEVDPDSVFKQIISSWEQLK